MSKKCLHHFFYCSLDVFFLRFGQDNNPTILDDVNCPNNNYLTILQCSYSTYIYSGCSSDYYDATVYCCEFNSIVHLITTYIDTTRVWNSNPYPGMIRLQGGNYSNQGRVEVYCNGQWGTICDHGFGSTEASVICRQLGYSNYIKYLYLQRYGFYI